MEAKINRVGGLDRRDWAVIDACPMFRDMGEALAGRLIGDGAVRHFERGQSIFLEGDRADAFYLILDGWVKLFRLTPDGDEAVLHVFAPGETFAEAVVFLGGRYPASTEAASKSRLLRIDMAHLRRLISEHRETAFAMMAAIARHTEMLTGQIEILKVMTAPQRVADFFLSQTTVSRGPARIVLPHDKHLIARRLGMTPESFSRALARLHAEGVAVEREVVDIADLGRLRAFLSEDEVA